MTAWLDAHPGEAIALLVVAYWLTWALAATPALILERRLRREAAARAVMRERLLVDLGAELADEAEAHLREVAP